MTRKPSAKQPPPPVGDGATLAPPIGDVPTLPMPAPPARRTTAADPSPSAATLATGDPQAQALLAAEQRRLGPAAAGGGDFGDYQLLEPIAKGGMGIVYKARQRKLNRIVAIKMILAGQFADQTDVDRFYVEAEAAAALSHPNIVAIHEVGEVQGQHFFSMDYVEGQSLSGCIQASPLPPRRGAELVRTLAETMQFAHDRGIVHRDLKPSNVLLDQRQRPLITDFGLAKHVTGQSQLTMSGAIVGTPSYMPPEQAAGQGDQVGPWSDLYSLGAILYEVLAGRPPFRAATPFETIRQVLETEPLSPRLVNPQVPRDLETICLKCLQKERSRRYASAQELADELGRFLRGEPIQARPIGQLARFWRLCRRYPVTASAIAAALLMLAAAAGVSTVAYVQTSAALAESEQSLRDALAAVDDFFTTVSESTLLNQPGLQPVRRDLLMKALAYYEQFLRQRADDPLVQNELAAALFRIGLITEALQSPDEALPSYEQAKAMQVRLLARRPGDPAALQSLGDTLTALGTARMNKQQYGEAKQEYLEAERIRRQLAALQPDNSEWQRSLANASMNVGRVTLAEYNAGQLDEQDADFRPRMAEVRQRFEQAQEIRQQALARDPQHPKLRRDLGKGFYTLANLPRALVSVAEAERQFQNAIAVFDKLVLEHPEDLENQKLLAISYRLLADVLSVERPDDARRWYQQAIDRLEPLAARNPDVVEYQTERAGLLINLSLLESQAGNSAASRDALLSARDILKPLAERFPGVPRYRLDLAVTLRELAIEQAAGGEGRAAEENLREAVRLLDELVKEYPREADYAALLDETKSTQLAAPPLN